ncbi:FAD-dependent monooxygenase [Williamsia deligens]|uniref:FAD-dependent monooxygenase n=1 Tax=Williamsia deligens TaxID=321325 RepID=A0ABW3GFF7_9NOCA|nr:FAD-dependent monooxygenase [Williamsia deligens]MCP2196037.1 2-polyprenyl-6-methoxyphenol hydroxylase [Williamsia deligens]
MSTRSQVPVVICGAGASGATLALLLASRGIASTVLDRRRDPLAHPAAHVINARSLEIWREIGSGLAEEIAAMSPPIEDVNLIRWCSTVGAPAFGEIDLLSEPEQLERVRSHSDHLISHVGQHLLMPALWRRIDDEPLVDFRRGTRVTGLTQDGTGATVHTDTGDVSAPYVVAADGANSALRDAVGVTLTGPVLARMGSAFFRSPDLHPAERPLLTWIYQPRFAGVLIAHADDHYILMGTYLHPQQPMAADPERYWSQTLPAVLGADNTYEMVSTGTWMMTSQTASEFRKDRVLFIGDAAHRFPHTGGYGLNSGVQDAHNVAWKIDAVLNHGADDALLDTYEIERRPVVERFAEHSVRNHFHLDEVTRHFGATNSMLHRATTAMGRAPLTWLPDPLAARLSEGVVRGGLSRTAILGRDSARARRVRARAAEAIPSQLPHFVSTGLEFGYRYGGPLIDGGDRRTEETSPDDVVEYVPAVRVGGRLPHLPVAVGDNRTSLLQMVDPDPTTITLVTSTPLDWQTRLGERVPAGMRLSVVDLTAICADPDAAARILGTARGGAVAVRCDGHIIWCSEDAAEDSSASLVALLETRWAPLVTTATAHGHDRPEGIRHDHQRS